MDLLAKERMLFVLIFVVAHTPCAQAAEGFYRLTAVDYFSMKVLARKTEASAPLWEDPDHQPPKVVLDLLEDPNELTARRYLQWNRDRLTGMARAQRALEEAAATFPLEDGE